MHARPPPSPNAPAPPRQIDLSKFKSSFETNHWSDNNPIWREHFVENPRLPRKGEGEHSWETSNYPSDLSKFLGRQNIDTKNSLISLAADGRLRNGESAIAGGEATG